MKSYIIVTLISALLISTLFFALPKTEVLVPFTEERFDLNTKSEDYWKQEIILELNIEPKHKAFIQERVNEGKDVIYKRLQKIGVEEIQIVDYEPSEEELENQINLEEEENLLKRYIKVIVQTTKDEQLVNRLITSTGRVKIMLPGPELEDLGQEQEDQFQLYMPENYEETKWNRDAFRNIHINDLIASEGQRSYFGIFKPKFGNRGEFRKFIRENENETIGVLMDSFVIPIQISPEMAEVFAIGLGPDSREAEIQNIILNTGVVPATNISVLTSQEKQTEIYEIDHIQVILAISISIVSIIYFLYQREKEEKEKILQYAFSLLLIFSISLTILKIWQIPIDLFLLIPAGILGTIFVKTMYTCPTESRFILLLSLAVFALMTTLGTGYIPILGNFLLFIVLLSFITEILTKVYFKHIKIINS